MFDRHPAEITVMQFTGHSLPVHQSMSVPWDFYLVPYCQPSLPTRFLLITAIGMCHFLPVHHFGMACFAWSKVNIQQYFAVPADHRVKIKGNEKKGQILRSCQNMKVTVIPLVIGTLETIPKELVLPSWLELLNILTAGWRVRPHPNECPGYDTKQSNGEVPVMLELWGLQSNPSFAIAPRFTLAQSGSTW